MFAEQNWTLITEVCDSCNQTFGRELDLHLNRDSFEACLRVDSELKPASAADKLRNRRMKATLKADGPFDGARVLMKPTNAGDNLVPVPTSQVGFRRPGEDWVFLTEPEWSTETIAAAAAGPDVEVRVIAEAGGLNRLRETLASLGFHFAVSDTQRDVSIATGRVQVQFDFVVDTTIRRAAAGIAFNYAAKVLGAAVVRRSAFDTIREFIKHGKEPQPMVTAQHRSILVGPDRRDVTDPRVWSRMVGRTAMSRRARKFVQPDHIWRPTVSERLRRVGERGVSALLRSVHRTISEAGIGD